jgi:hypothetical protein
MDLVQKFHLAAEATNIQMSGGMEVKRKYPIVFADKNIHPTFGVMVTLMLSLVGNSVAVCPLPQPIPSPSPTRTFLTQIRKKRPINL